MRDFDKLDHDECRRSPELSRHLDELAAAGVTGDQVHRELEEAGVAVADRYRVFGALQYLRSRWVLGVVAGVVLLIPGLQYSAKLTALAVWALVRS